jgi:hypothetical protein
VPVWASQGRAAVCAARGSAWARETPVGEVQAETGHAQVHGGARLIAMGGGVHGACGWVARTRRVQGGV